MQNIQNTKNNYKPLVKLQVQAHKQQPKCAIHMVRLIHNFVTKFCFLEADRLSKLTCLQIPAAGSSPACNKIFINLDLQVKAAS